jgi:aminoglycoside phosphotransferase (APT) family kinase protein
VEIAALVRRVFSPRSAFTVVRVAEGVSTYVYRLVLNDTVFYLRVLPEVGKTFAPELLAHRLLRERGVRVPEVVYYEPMNELLGLSIMVTTAVAGQSLAVSDANTPAIVAAAGRDLAVLNTLPVSGFGWVERSAPSTAILAAEDPTARAFWAAQLDSALATLRATVLAADEAAALMAILARHDGWLDAAEACLAHGDFDPTHIFAEAGRYTGIIDLGEIRGTDRWYDLAHFALRDGEHFGMPLFPWLLRGYGEVVLLPPDAAARINFVALLIGIRLLARSIAKRGIAGLDRSALRAIRRALGTPTACGAARKNGAPPLTRARIVR